ncbi:MAG: hypothetical protein LBV55_01365 [Acholeplasmatales bacterium]|jgi:ATPase subunit of ABC transporter with duplicated ATPase domains|nr:hypothetical protein [Acholeplasmatales bacterium]
MKLKLLLFLMTALDPEILILDEVTRNISPINQEKIQNLIQSFKGCIVAVSHDRSFLEACFSKIWELTSRGLIKIT